MMMLVLSVVATGTLLASSAEGGMQRSEQSPRERVAKVACWVPALGYGVRRATRCSRIEKMKQLPSGVWWVQLRRPPVYCFKVYLGSRNGDQADIPGVGRVSEVRCPASAYARMRKPNLRVELRGLERGQGKNGFVSLTALGPERTRVLVEANGDYAWLADAYCGEAYQRRPITLSGFYSFRSTTLVRFSLRSLITTPHSVYFDSGGAHGGTPIGCANLTPS
jgi:hypothetical protein